MFEHAYALKWNVYKAVSKWKVMARWQTWLKWKLVKNSIQYLHNALYADGLVIFFFFLFFKFVTATVLFSLFFLPNVGFQLGTRIKETEKKKTTNNDNFVSCELWSGQRFILINKTVYVNIWKLFTHLERSSMNKILYTCNFNVYISPLHPVLFKMVDFYCHLFHFIYCYFDFNPFGM